MSNNEDQQHLNLLSIFHYVVGGLMYFFGCFPMIHFFMGVLMVSGVLHDNHDEAALRIVGLFFVFFSMIAIFSAWTLATLVIFAGRNLARRTRYKFCLVMGGVVCIFMPFGTVLGVFTIIVLCRPSVKELFGVEMPPAAE